MGVGVGVLALAGCACVCVCNIHVCLSSVCLCVFVCVEYAKYRTETAAEESLNGALSWFVCLGLPSACQYC